MDESMRKSLEHPHAESYELAELGFQAWAACLPVEPVDLVIPGAGIPVRWRPGEGWSEEREIL